ncbi:site-specific integrase [Shewanella sp. MMG014]|uniref:site-specific integrase n=1 Tax=Shewanella sp. MMG014 TaxID=2822691 RepID=UPI001B362066|nr:site-specific integrase [Shewanella sp. MMG014]MBQ4892162.1 site-specific integrase [Shewanella sp. MMG014]
MNSHLSKFDTETIKHAVNNAFPEELIDYHATIAHEIINLTRVLSHQYQREFPALAVIKSLAEIKITNPSTSTEKHKQNLRFLYRELTSKRQLEQYYFTAFIFSVMLSPSQDHKQFEQYKALTLFVCLKLYMMGLHESAIKSVCNEVRQWSLGNRDALSNLLPDIVSKQFPDLINELERLRAKENKAASKQTKEQASKFFVSYRDSNIDKQGFTRKRRPHYGQDKTDLIFTDLAPNITELKEIKIGDNWEKEESNSIQTQKAYLYSSNTPSKNGYVVKKLTAQIAHNQILKNHMSLPCNIGQASEFEISCLIKALFNSNTISSECRSSALTSLILGCKIELLSKIDFIPEKNSIKRKHVLPTQALRKTISNFATPVQSEYYLPLPTQIQVNDLVSYSPTIDDEFKILISNVNKTHGTHLTKNKIDNTLTHYFKQSGIDPTLSALVKGDSPNNYPELSYTQIPMNKLIQSYQRYITYLEKHGKISFEYHKDYCQELGILGSGLPILDIALTKLIKILQTEIDKFDNKFTSERHNLITYYTQITLALSSGYRPVSGWLGLISDLDLKTGQFWISDKEIQQNTIGRVVILPDITIKILKQYVDYLMGLTWSLNHNQRKISQRFTSAANGKAHLFFYINNEEVEEVTPKAMAKHFDSVLPFPVNWHRHYIRTLLAQNDIPPEIIAAWMGHAELNEPAFTRFSSYSFKDLHIVSECINHTLIKIGFTEVKYV